MGLSKLIPLLVKSGSEIEAKYSGRTALHVAIEISQCISSVKELLDLGASISVEDHFRFTPLLSSISYNNIEMVKLVLNRGANVNHKVSSYSIVRDKIDSLEGSPVVSAYFGGEQWKFGMYETFS